MARFLQDWGQGNEEHLDRILGKLVQGQSPFQFHALDRLVVYLLQCEEFIVKVVWDPDYCPQLFGTLSRPPLAAVAKDMIAMVLYLRSLNIKTPKRLDIVFRGFLRQCIVYSIPSVHTATYADNFHDGIPFIHDDGDLTFGLSHPETVGIDLYLYDMFTVVIGSTLICDSNSRIWEESYQRFLPTFQMSPKSDPDRHFRVQTDYFPGTMGLDFLLPSFPTAKSMETHSPIDDIDADYICSGPYSLALTDNITQHFTLDSHGKLLLFWEGLCPLQVDRSKGCPDLGAFYDRWPHSLSRYAHLLRIHLVFNSFV